MSRYEGTLAERTLALVGDLQRAERRAADIEAAMRTMLDELGIELVDDTDGDVELFEDMLTTSMLGDRAAVAHVVAEAIAVLVGDALAASCDEPAA